ncbi:indolepyruvate oxidoreductase subunit beta [bacterium]|nr:indolepyruvate oxidoreductase subunit beta [bacterium]
MKKDIILAGVGGQGILTIATVIGQAAVSSNMFLKQAEVHGMSQRGGDVQSHLRISDQEIFSDLIPMGQADLILSVEPMESLRYLPYLNENGWLIANATPFVNIPNYPEKEEVYNKIKTYKNHVLIDADAIAKEIGSARSMNMVILGAAVKTLGFSLEQIENSIKEIFGKKGDAIVEANIKALRAGFEAGK